MLTKGCFAVLSGFDAVSMSALIGSNVDEPFGL
jgi:hypothetical protein